MQEIARDQLANDPKNKSKPANIVEMILDGKMKTWFAENVLIEQPIANAVKYEKKSVDQLLKAAGLDIVGYVRFKVGEVAVS